MPTWPDGHGAYATQRSANAICELAGGRWTGTDKSGQKGATPPGSKNVANWQTHFFSWLKSRCRKDVARKTEFANPGKLSWQTGKLKCSIPVSVANPSGVKHQIEPPYPDSIQTRFSHLEPGSRWTLFASPIVTWRTGGVTHYGKEVAGLGLETRVRSTLQDFASSQRIDN